MFVHHLSDIHLDFYVKEKIPGTKMNRQIHELLKFSGILNIPENKRDVFIIPGDLGHYNIQNIEFLKVLKSMFKYVIFTPGNHDLYLISNNQKEKYQYNSHNRLSEMKEWCYENDIIYLDGQIIDIEGYKFSGCSMFWDKSYYEFLENKRVSDTVVLGYYKDTMNDCNFILGGEDVYNIPLAYGAKYKKISFDPFEYFKNEYDKLQNIDNVDVLVSHYGPVPPPNMPLGYCNSLTTSFYYFDGVNDINRIQPKYWVFGHTHKKYEFKINNTNMLCNPFGYPNESNIRVDSFELK